MDTQKLASSLETKVPSKVELIPIFEDNYVFLIVDESKAECLIVDPGDASTIINFLDNQNLRPLGILLTHHHLDHIGGVPEIIKKYSISAYASIIDSRKMHFPVKIVNPNEELSLGAFSFRILELPGHTLGHIAFWEEKRNWLFSGDVLFGLGCGRVFEGTYSDMYSSIQKIKSLPNNTLVFCTHEYTETNLNFCKRLSPLDLLPLVGDDEELEIYENQLRNQRSIDLPSVPLKLGFEQRVNPFLLAKNLKEFSELRDLRNKA